MRRNFLELVTIGVPALCWVVMWLVVGLVVLLNACIDAIRVNYLPYYFVAWVCSLPLGFYILYRLHAWLFNILFPKDSE